MTMTAKFEGKCRACNCSIAQGELIVWTRGAGARHASQAQCSEARAALDARRQALYTANAVAVPVIDVSSTVAFLAGARERGLKAPRAHFLHMQDGVAREITLTLAKDTSKNPGAVYVKVDGEYVGKVVADGKAFGLAQALLDTLTAIASNPAQAAKAYAALRGRCSFCSLALTDAGSVEAGYGPVCAKKYGLPHQALGTVSLQTVAA